VMGTSDLAKDLQCAHTAMRLPLLPSLGLCLLAARATGRGILDGVHLDLADDAGFRAACVQGRELGFDGKTLIHPKTVTVANEVFAPSAEEIAWSRKIIEAHAQATAEGRGVVVVDGKPLPPQEPTRLWCYHKPVGLVTSTKDEQGRPTIFDKLPDDLPRVMSIGRLDLNSEGLLLLTNDGEIKRKLELPSTGWLRKYRVRVKGQPTDESLEPLRKGLVIDGERFQPMVVNIDRQQGANAWLTLGLREGKNREIRRAMADLGLTVNRLIRVSYGPFQLGQLKSGEVEELRRKVVRDQLGLDQSEGSKAGTAENTKANRVRRKPRPNRAKKSP